MSKGAEKRQRLVDAARRVIHRQGFARTTLAHVASEAEIPLGNVYYYFKTKESMAEAVIDARREELEELMRHADEGRDAEAALIAFLDASLDSRDAISVHGCPYASLAAELEKADDALAERAAGLLRVQFDWMHQKFRELGHGRAARSLATELLGNAQGASLLAHTLHDAALMTRRFRALQRWVSQQA